MYEMRVVPRPADCGKNLIVSIKSLMDILEDVAEQNSAAVGDPIKKGRMPGMVWIVREWQIKFERFIGFCEPINVKTWTIGGEGPAAVSLRQFLVSSDDGEVLCRANASYVVFDSKKNRPARISKKLCALYGPQDHYALEPDKSRLRAPAEFEYEKDFELRRSDIDYNDHVHNTKYVEFALEVLPEEIYLGNDIKEIRIVYLRPLTHDSNVTLRYTRTEEISEFASADAAARSCHYVTVCADEKTASVIKMK